MIGSVQSIALAASRSAIEFTAPVNSAELGEIVFLDRWTVFLARAVFSPFSMTVDDGLPRNDDMGGSASIMVVTADWDEPG